MKFSLTQLVARPVAEVYAYLAEPRNRPEWQSTLRSVEMLTEGPTRLGTRWKERAIGFGTSEMEIVVFDPDRAWGERARSPVGDATVVLRFDPGEGHPAATQITLEAELEIPQLVGPIARFILSTIFRRDLARAEAILRARARERSTT